MSLAMEGYWTESLQLLRGGAGRGGVGLGGGVRVGINEMEALLRAK